MPHLVILCSWLLPWRSNNTHNKFKEEVKVFMDTCDLLNHSWLFLIVQMNVNQYPPTGSLKYRLIYHVIFRSFKPAAPIALFQFLLTTTIQSSSSPTHDNDASGEINVCCSSKWSKSWLNLESIIFIDIWLFVDDFSGDVLTVVSPEGVSIEVTVPMDGFAGMMLTVNYQA